LESKKRKKKIKKKGKKKEEKCGTKEPIELLFVSRVV